MTSAESHVCDKVEEPSITASVKEEKAPERKDYSNKYWFVHEDDYKGVIEKMYNAIVSDIEKEAVRLGKSFDVASISFAQLLARGEFPKEWNRTMDGFGKKQIMKLLRMWMKEAFMAKAAFTYATFEHEVRMRNMEEFFWAMKMKTINELPKVKPVEPVEEKKDDTCCPSWEAGDPETTFFTEVSAAIGLSPAPEKPTVILDLTKEEEKSE